jgi:hypothetical protein
LEDFLRLRIHGRGYGLSIKISLYAPDGFDDYGLDRCLIELVGVLDRRVGDSLDHVHAIDDLPEYAVSVSFRISWIAIAAVKGRVIGDVNKELAPGAVYNIALAEHGDCSAEVFKSVMGFIANWNPLTNFAQVSGVSARDNGLVFIDLVEDGFVV